jgi:hypothetical protein
VAGRLGGAGGGARLPGGVPVGGGGGAGVAGEQKYAVLPGPLLLSVWLPYVSVGLL